MIETCYLDEMEEDLREFARHDATLSFSIPLIAGETDEGCASPQDPPQLVSHTRDVCSGGMALLIPSLPFMYRYLLGPDYTLRFTLHLPDGPIQIEATPVYDRPIQEEDMNLGFVVTGRIEIEATPRQYERYEKDGSELGCLIGVKIKRMSEHDRALYQDYLDILEIERSITILADETEADSADELQHRDEMTESIAAPARFAPTATPPRYSMAAPYEY